MVESVITVEWGRAGRKLPRVFDGDSVLSDSNVESNVNGFTTSRDLSNDTDLPSLIRFDSPSPRVNMFHGLVGDNSLAPLKADGAVDIPTADNQDDLDYEACNKGTNDNHREPPN